MRISDWSSDVCSSDLGVIASSVTSAALAATAKPPAQCSSGREPRLAWGFSAGSCAIALATRSAKSAAIGKLVCPRIATDAKLQRLQVSPNRSEEHTSELQSLMRHSYAASSV